MAAERREVSSKKQSSDSSHFASGCCNAEEPKPPEKHPLWNGIYVSGASLADAFSIASERSTKLQSEPSQDFLDLDSMRNFFIAGGKKQA